MTFIGCIPAHHGETPGSDSLDWLLAIGSGTVADHTDTIRDTAGDGTVWVMGGGDLAGQFLDAGLLDEVTLHISPVFLTNGKPLLPRDLYSDRLTLVHARQIGQFIEAIWHVSHT